MVVGGVLSRGGWVGHRAGLDVSGKRKSLGSWQYSSH